MQKYIGPAPSVSARAAKLVDALVADAGALRCIVSTGEAGERRIDLGAAAPGGIEAGRRLAEICMGGLGVVSFTMSSGIPRWPLGITVHSSNPVIACLGSQYGGWTMSDEATGFFALGSGPGARAIAQGGALQGARLRRPSQQGGARHRGRQAAAAGPRQEGRGRLRRR